MRGLAIALSVAAITVGACGSSGGACDQRQIAKGLEDIASVPRDRSPIAAAIIVEACAAAPMPGGLRRALNDLAQMGQPGFGVLARGIADSMLEAPGLWEKACGRPVIQITQDLQAFVRDGQASFTAACDAARSGLGTAAELDRADPALALVAALAHVWLATEGTTPVQARTLARALLAPPARP